MTQTESTFLQAAVEASGGGTRADVSLHQATVEVSEGGARLDILERQG